MLFLYFAIFPLLFHVLEVNCQKLLSKDRHHWRNAETSSYRLFSLMRNYNEDSFNKIAKLNPYRFMGENHPFYEMGYLMAIIIEKYRIMVEVVKHPIQHLAETPVQTARKMTLAQNLWMEIWHLCMMFHEIPTKYGTTYQNFTKEEDLPTLAINKEEEKIIQKEIKDAIIATGIAKSQASKAKQNILEHVAKHTKDGKYTLTYGTKSHTRSWWPLEYGWEIDYLW